jgi:diaminohydroxyphosphoribosylaminopyrimidine deaminase/5-amino-6-(5-phosphoribosylamino)uracil reductase
VAAAGISRVVIGMQDPNPLVDGSGADYLRKRKIEVNLGVLEQECRELNRPFIKLITASMPWVVMKAGTSLDGRLSYQAGCGGVITGPESRSMVHRMRDENDAILVGIGTVAADDPALTTRLTNKKGRDPLRIILDTHLNIDENAKVLNCVSDAQTWIFCSNNAERDKIKRLADKGVAVYRMDECPTGVDLKQVLKTVAEHGYGSVLVEGGARIHGCFLNEMLVDRVNLFIAPIFAGNDGAPLIGGLKTVEGKDSAVRLVRIRTRKYGEDLMISGDVVYPG